MPVEQRNILLIAGEASSDQIAAELINDIRKLRPDWRFFGIGGKACAETGMELLVDSSCLSVVGLFEWKEKAKQIFDVYRLMSREIKTRDFDGAVLLDLPDFNLLMAPKIKKRKLPVLYYISPQVWVWRRYRVKKIKRFIDKMLVLFPFEKTFYDASGVDAVFVGHPLLDRLKGRDVYREQSEIERAPRIAVLPGSRRSELGFHSPVLKEAIQLLKKKYPQSLVRVPVASTLSIDKVRAEFGDHVEVIEGNSHEVLKWADIAWVASGTATLETALLGTPFVLFYKTNALSLGLFRVISRYFGFVGLPNLLHQVEVVKELIQDNFTAKNLFDCGDELIRSQNVRGTQTERLVACRSMLGSLGASARAAQAVIQTVEELMPMKSETLRESPSRLA